MRVSSLLVAFAAFAAFAALAALAACVDDAALLPSREPIAAPAAPANPADIETRAHAVLVQHCGECHERHRPTAKPGALAIFDLDQPDWPSRFDEHRLTASTGRFSSKPEADRATFAAFRDARLATLRSAP